MKKLLFLFLFMFVTSYAFADVTVIYNDSTKEIYAMNNKDIATMPKTGYTKVILDGKVKDYPLNKPINYYRFINGNFVLNIQKISKEENAKIASKEEAIENKMIQDKLSAMAIVELKAEGKSFKYHE